VHHPGWVLHPALGMGRATWFQAVGALRPGGYFAFTMFGKWLRGQPLYRYQNRDFHRSGWCETAVRIPLNGAAGHEPHLSEDGRALLSNISQWCQTNGVRVAYSLPWSYCPPDQLRQFRKSNAEIIAEIMPVLPVLRDDSLGANTDTANFADTSLHLTTRGAAQRTDEFGRQIQQWNIWTREELDRAIAALQSSGRTETNVP
jgi:hypothetical protein